MKLTPLESWIVDRTGIQERSRRALEAYQVKKVRETVEYAKKNSLFYRKQLKDIRTEDIRSLKDLQNLPFTFPQDIRQNPYGFLCVPQRAVKRIVTLNTSGTTGEGKRIFFTEKDLDDTIDFFRYGMSCLTDRGDRVLVLLPGNAYGSIGDLLKKTLALSNIGCTVHGVLADPEEAARCIEERNITCIVGIPMQVLYLSRAKSEVFKKRIKKVLLSTDYVPEVLIHELTQEYGCSVFTHYGMTEMGYGGGVECEALNGYHMREGDLYFEIINPDTGEAVENGQYGEVVFTTLTRQAMPLIRYRTGDIAAFSSTTCPCGTFLKTMKKAQGRMDNRVELRENQSLYLRELDEIILDFKAVMDYKAYMDIESILIVGITTKNVEDFQSLKSEIAHRLQDILYRKLGYGMDMELIFNGENKPNQIANSMIKRKIHDYRKVR
ncbi:DVU_1553 family AMP-dependent CoA ligase [Geosporobacter ferrireducens]|uniref:AMP-binding protein n=1 Tax=Geosporobacter ferrireducens TaxID=1424294 RepID=A0A1D8GKQ0_9FIRM|nr:AMP-binding protein [Geosporobacter ferrireducens]AOT71467.1 AMP-binding protein [Geosporobacter ferrireducens]